MFEEPKTLIIIYKDNDAISLNQLKKLVDTKDDDIENGNIIGTEDGSVKIVSWNEKTWLDNKRAGNTGDIDDKLLFIGDIKGVDKLIPTLDIKFNQHGVSYGFSGKQAVIMVDPKPMMFNRENYDGFIEDLKNVCNASTVREKRKIYIEKNDDHAIKKIIRWTADYLFCDGIGIMVNAFRDAKTIRNQQLLYGVVKLYQNDLERFMKS